MATRAAKLALRGKALSDTGTEIGIVNNADATAITIDSNENVGIGTTNPVKFLDVGINSNAAAIDANIRLNTHYGTLNTARGGIQMHDGGNVTGQIDTRYNGSRVDMHFGSLYNGDYNSTSRMVITGAGNVGIGIASPTAKLHIEAPDNTDLMRFTVTGNEMWAFKGASAAGSNDTVSFGIAGGTQAMAWDESGIVTKPYQPAFLVNAGSNSALPVLAATKVNFDSEIFDQNSDFNTTTQTFTAPVTGKYQFNVQLLWLNWDNGAAYYYLQIVTSNRTYYELYNGAERSSDAAYCYGHIHVLADMDAGDTAYVALYQNSGNSQTTYDGQSIFTGHLAC